jgi:hypothetical protein
MKRSLWTLTIVAVAVLVAVPALAADPKVSRSVSGSEDGISLLEIRITASGESVYAVKIKDESGSIKDILAPKGWVGISSGSDVLFRTGSKPIRSGSSMVFRLKTTNEAGGLSFSFQDENGVIGSGVDI